MANIFVAATATFNGKALTRGKKEISAFDKQVKKLGRTFASVFSTYALMNYSKRAVQAFAADEKAAKALEIQLRNTGFAFAAPEVEDYITNLQRTTGVLDDQLRPAFQQLLTVTGSVTKSQQALDTALNVSAATGKSLTDVSAALTRGFSGNTQGLSRLGAGISKTTLKAGKMEDILAELNEKFAGQAQARLTTYAGKLDLLTVAAEDAREIIGKGIVDALTNLGKDKNIEDLTDNINKLATGIASVVTGIGALVGALNTLRNVPGIKQIIDVLTSTNLLNMLSKLGGMSESKPTSNFTYGLGASATQDIERAKEALRIKNANKLRAEENAKIKAKNDLEKLKEKYDIERIGLQTALNAATDEETKLRLAEKLAILDGNAARAQEYLKDRELLDISNLELLARLEQINALKELTKGALGAAFAMGAVQRGEYSNISNVPAAVGVGGGGGGGGITMPSMAIAMGAVQRGEYATPSVTVNVEGSILTDDDLTNTIQRTILQINKQGRGTTPAGGLSGGT